MRRKGIVLLINLLLASVLIYLLLRSDDTEQIRRQTERLSQVVARTGREPDLALVGRINALQRLLAEDCSIRVGSPVPILEGRNAVLGAYRSAWPQVKEAHLEFVDLVVTLEEEGERAETRQTARARWQIGAADPVADERVLRMAWRKNDGDWQITAIEVHTP